MTFVTDDSKSDWWREINGETISPLPPLIAEMVTATGQPFHMYRPGRFVGFAGEHLQKPVAAEIVGEVKSVRLAETESNRAAKRLRALTSNWNESLYPTRSLREAMEPSTEFDDEPSTAPNPGDADTTPTIED
jgi:hypothetical protein